MELEDGNEILVIAVSDGAGTAVRSDAGSSLAVAHFLDRFVAGAMSGPDLEAIDRPFVDRWFQDVRDEIAAMAETDGADIRDYEIGRAHV